MTPMALPPFDRATMLARLANEQFDVLVIGGGITGAGTALDAASRGLRTALVERDDFASGTSSKSSKLVHGGLRYLQQGDVRLVYEALAERQRLLHNAPHLVHVLPFLIPILTKDGLVGRKLARALGTAMWGYDATGGVRIGKIHQKLTREEALVHLPTMPPERLAWAYLYYDAQTDDARLCLAAVRTAAAHGAAVANHASVVALPKHSGGAVTGATIEADGERIEVRARAVVNAAGVWSDELRTLDEGHDPEAIRPAKGIHLMLPWAKVRNDIAAVIPVPKDRRSLFVVPWGEHTYVGTTDTDYHGSLDDPQCTKDDIEYVLRALNFSITTHITERDITGVWAGLRPLVNIATSGRTADLSRRHRVFVSESGVVSVMGGKLTTYRRMAADAVDVVVERLDLPARSRTKRLLFTGAEGFVAPPESASVAGHLALRYGSESHAVQQLFDLDERMTAPLVPGLPYLGAEAVFAARHEMARTLDDVLSRRTRARLLDRDATRDAAPAVAALVAGELGWDETETERQVKDYLERDEHERRSGISVDVTPFA
jgi:glycerol-3-phosphate dehydrogenase